MLHVQVKEMINSNGNNVLWLKKYKKNNSNYPLAKEGVVTIDVANDTRTSSVKLNDVYHVPGA
ncbi:hypothetical protein Pint_11130 [Pistacia integerrima]|uniref:Uncharacterized protein n=1 Tax=Pistacia integerrima TaxID=434235 RepID=A0ACC0XIL0_9ROSI|nr:hypothetical protein Pint_11130 [Pistacia integerrima]